MTINQYNNLIVPFRSKRMIRQDILDQATGRSRHYECAKLLSCYQLWRHGCHCFHALYACVCNRVIRTQHGKRQKLWLLSRKCCSEYNWIRGLLCVMLGAFHYGSNWKPLEQPFKGSARLVSVSLCGLVFPVQCKYIRAKTPLMFLWWFFSNISKCSKWPAEKFISKKQLTEALTSADPATVSGLSLNIWLWLYYVLFRFRRYPRAFLRISCLCWSQLKQ